MKRKDTVALSRAAIQKLASGKVGVVGLTEDQRKKLARHKKQEIQAASRETQTAPYVRKAS